MRSQILHVRWLRRLSKSVLRALSCCAALAGCSPRRRVSPTSSDLLGRKASSGFFSIFCLRLSLLAGRGLSSTSFEAERLAVGVFARAALELEAMAAEGCAPSCGWVIDDDEVRARTSRDVLGRAMPTGGVGDSRASILSVVERDSTRASCSAGGGD